MKKLIITIAAVASMIASNAASFDWATSGKFVSSTDKTTVLKSFDVGTSIVLVYLGNSTTEGWTLNWNSAVETTSVGSIKTGPSAGKVGGTLTFVYGSDGAYVNNDVFGIMFKDSTGTLSQLYSASDDSVISATFEITGMSNNTWTSASTFNPSSSNFYAAAIPEPTSGLLLLVGIAGLVLKRKRA